MPPRKDPEASTTQSRISKRKDPPQSSNSQNTNKGRAAKCVKPMDARSILTQNADGALKNGELDLQAFLKAREFEIKALEDGMQRSKSSRTQRAFQQVPRDLRRRTASHNVKRVPKRLHKRAAREMREDNTPTVDTSKRKPGSSRARIRAETAKRLGILATKKPVHKSGSAARGLETRVPRPKIRKNLLNDPPKPIPKFRKRQIHKTWLPTHMWHAKRAKMTEPKRPLWRFAVPITSTEKSYRPTHRSGGARGAVIWDMSYMSTIGLEGPVESLEKILKAVGVLDPGLWEGKGENWMAGKRSWVGWLTRETKDKHVQIGPSTVIWCSSEQDSTNEAGHMSKKKLLRRVFVRMHPAVFLEVWTELLRLSKLQRPAVHVEDLRFEIGSVSITGPGSTEALIGILHPYHQADAQESHAKAFSYLAGVTNPGSLPANSVLAFSIMDPRLRYPPRPTTLPNPNDEEANFALLETLSAWPADESNPSSALFNRNARFKATRLPAQKSINRRKGDAQPGGYPSMVPSDPPIPIMLFTSRSVASAATQGTWTLLAPWKCILPIWYGLVHYPLTSGGNPRFGGLDELRQIHFEHGAPWFPADYPGTHAGFAWEAEERTKRKSEWDRRPKGKRIEWDSLDLGAGRKGEIGRGWACDFERLCGVTPLPENASATSTTRDTESSKVPAEKHIVDSPFQHLTREAFTHLLSGSHSGLPQSSTLATIRITLINRGIATPCARIYRLPRAPASAESSSISSPPATALEEWLRLLPGKSDTGTLPNPKSKSAKNIGRIPLNVPVPQRVRLLAQSLLQDPPLSYPGDKTRDGSPLVPDEEDLIGFVTTGEFNLAEGKGVAIGTVAVAKVIENLRANKKKGSKEGRLCIVRNSGEKIGRLARWEAV